MTTTSSNLNLNLAKRTKNDEFYTRLEDVEAELVHYENHFRDKTVYLNCDDQDSAFWQYFSGRFDDLGLRRLVATKYPDGLQFRQDRDKGLQVIQLTGDGDFRSDECVELLKQSDIVVTNPPFSLFREYVAQLVEHEKQFLILGNINAVTYKEIFPLIKGGKVWPGMAFNKAFTFAVPDSYFSKTGERDEEGRQIVKVPAIAWFTNLDHRKRHEELDLIRYYEGNEDAYPKYDNYDAIEVSRTKDIPADYEGVMGVPITFLDKWNPDQFDLLGISEQNVLGGSNGLWNSGSQVKHPMVSGKRTYARVLLRRVVVS